MNQSRWTNYLQIGANVGILLGLVLVGIQIHDTNRIASAQFDLNAWEGSMDSKEIIIGEGLSAAWAKAKMNSADLTDEDLVIIDAFLAREWLLNARISRLEQSGFRSQNNDLTAAKWVYDYLGNETGLRWWRAYSNGGTFLDINPKLRDKIDQMLERLGDDHRFQHKIFMENMRDQAGT